MHERPHSTGTGVTLVELLVTLSVLAILLTLGVGGFRSLIADAKMTNAANSLLGHLQFTRSEAVKRSSRVMICPSADGQTCLSSKPSLWQGGYIVSVINDAGELIPPMLRRVDAEEMRGLTVDSGGIRSFVYLPDGTAQVDGTTHKSNWALKICDPQDPTRIRQVVIDWKGRTYVRCNEPSVYQCPATCP